MSACQQFIEKLYKLNERKGFNSIEIRKFEVEIDDDDGDDDDSMKKVILFSGASGEMCNVLVLVHERMNVDAANGTRKPEMTSGGGQFISHSVNERDSHREKVIQPLLDADIT